MPRGDNAQAGKQGFQRTDPKDLPGAAGVNPGSGAPTTGPGGGGTATVDYDALVTTFQNLDEGRRVVTEQRLELSADELRKQHPEAFKKAVDEYREWTSERGWLFEDAVDMTLMDLHENGGQPDLEFAYADVYPRSVRFSGDFALTEDEQTEIALITGRPAPESLTLAEGKNEWVSDYWRSRFADTTDLELDDTDYDLENTANTPQEDRLDGVMTRVRDRLETLERETAVALEDNYDAELSDEAMADRFIANHEDAWFDVTGQRR